MQPSDDLDDLIRELNASTPAAIDSDALAHTTADAAAKERTGEAASERAHQPASEPVVSGDTSRLERWLTLLRERGASDLLLVSGAPPVMRVDGRVLPLSESPLDGDDIQRAVFERYDPVSCAQSGPVYRLR